MAINTIKLLIYIPTYNRTRTIELQLFHLIPQIIGKPLIKLVVSDNSSNDGSWNTIQDLLAPHENSQAQRTPRNVGANANALLGLSRSEEADYVWILSDDTIVAPNAVETIFKQMASSPDLISVRMSELLPAHRKFDIRVDGITEVFQSTSWGQFGSLIYSRKFIGPSLEAGFGFHDSSFPHLAILFDACWKNTNVRVVEVDGSAIFSSSNDENLSGGVYSLSLSGRSTLLHFANPKERPGLARRWAKENCLGIAAFEEIHPLAAGASKSALVKYGGVRARLYLTLGRWLYVILSSKFGRSLMTKTRNSEFLMKMASGTGITFFTLPDRKTRKKLK